MNDLILLWGVLALLSYGGWCVSVAVRGLTYEAPLELLVVWWSGRILLVVASLVLLLAVSRGIIEIATWAIR